MFTEDVNFVSRRPHLKQESSLSSVSSVFLSSHAGKTLQRFRATVLIQRRSAASRADDGGGAAGADEAPPEGASSGA